MFATKRLDFTMQAEIAEGMTSWSLMLALKDIWETLPFADAMDREFNTDNGGYYRDEASVYHAELRRRRVA